MWPRVAPREVLQEVRARLEGFFRPNLKSPEHYFLCILLVNQVTKARSDSRGKELAATSQQEEQQRIYSHLYSPTETSDGTRLWTVWGVQVESKGEGLSWEWWTNMSAVEIRTKRKGSREGGRLWNESKRKWKELFSESSSNLRLSSGRGVLCNGNEASQPLSIYFTSGLFLHSDNVSSRVSPEACLTQTLVWSHCKVFGSYFQCFSRTPWSSVLVYSRATGQVNWSPWKMSPSVASFPVHAKRIEQTSHAPRLE